MYVFFISLPAYVILFGLPSIEIICMFSVEDFGVASVSKSKGTYINRYMHT